MRIKIVNTSTYYEAVLIRNELQEKYPEKTFQIRKTDKGTRFVVSERVFTKTEKGKKHGNAL
jgi:hypothetical protein